MPFYRCGGHRIILFQLIFHIIYHRVLIIFTFKHYLRQNGRIPLFLAIEVGNQSMCRELLTHLALEQLTTKSERGDYALHLVARRKDVDIARILVEYGANVDAQNVSLVSRSLDLMIFSSLF